MDKNNKRSKSSINQIECTSEFFTESSIESSYDVDSSILLSIMPEEVWLLIFETKTRAKSKTGTESLKNCSLASPYFRNILSKQRQLFLFPNFIECLTTTATKQQNRLSFKDLLKCRLVCPEWNTAIQNFHENANQRLTKMTHDQNEFDRTLIEINNYIRSDFSSRNFTSFVDHFEKTHGNDEVLKKANPFLGRSLRLFVKATPDQDARDVYEDMEIMLEDYGKHLWHFSVKLREADFLTNRLNVYSMIKDFVGEMPNLKSFKLDCYRVGIENNFESDDEFEVQFAGVMEELEAHISLNQLLQLKNLQFLSLNSVPSVIFNEIIRTSGQNITKLELTKNRGRYNPINNDIFSHPNLLPQLKELSIELNSLRDFERIENSQIAGQWNLEKFYFLYDTFGEFVKWSRVFEVISKLWSGSLKDLVLQMPFTVIEADKQLCLEASLSTISLQLPHLQRVKLIVQVPCSLDFLLPSKSTLERIEVIAKYNVDEEKITSYYKSLKGQQLVKFLGYENSEKDLTSNVLENFPKLNTFQVVTPVNEYDYRFRLFKAGKATTNVMRLGTKDLFESGLLTFTGNIYRFD